jgi:putative endonuclease
VKQFYVYILASRPGGALYVGVTSNLVRRLYEHRQKIIPGHTKRLHISRLVYFEVFDSALATIQREKNLKHWPRAWKTDLIGRTNATWRDLYPDIAGS